MFATGVTMGLAEWIFDDPLSCISYISAELQAIFRLFIF